MTKTQLAKIGASSSAATTQRTAAAGGGAVTSLMLIIGLLVFLGLPAVAHADNGSDHPDGWPDAGAAAAAAAGAGAVAAAGAAAARRSGPPKGPPPAKKPPPPARVTRDEEGFETQHADSDSKQNPSYDPGGLR